MLFEILFSCYGLIQMTSHAGLSPNTEVHCNQIALLLLRMRIPIHFNFRSEVLLETKRSLLNNVSLILSHFRFLFNSNGNLPRAYLSNLANSILIAEIYIIEKLTKNCEEKWILCHCDLYF